MTELDTTVTVIDAAARAHVGVILWGQPGLGKSAVVRALAAADAVPMETLIGSQREPVDIAGWPMVEDGVVRLAIPDWTKALVEANGGYLFLDLTDPMKCVRVVRPLQTYGRNVPFNQSLANMYVTLAGECMAGRPVIGVIRVQEIRRGNGRRDYTIVDRHGVPIAVADGFLRTCEGGTDRTYAYLLVGHLRWLEHQGLAVETVCLSDVARYMAAIGAEHAGPIGRPWRVGKSPYKQRTLDTAAACLKSFYLYQSSSGVNHVLAEQLNLTRLPSKLDRQRSLLGHITRELPSNPLTSKRRVRTRHPKLPPEGARDALVAGARTARDRMVVTWLSDGGFRIGELCGLYLMDLHLREGADCGQCRPRHVHICHREGNRNGARAKTKHPWVVEDGAVCGGLIRRVSPAMVHTYFDYMTTEYPRDVDHGMLLVQLHGKNRGQPWSPAAARGMLARTARRVNLDKVRPHSLRHEFATAVLNASGGNTIIARDAGGWASASTVEQVYAHVDADDPAFVAALNHVWAQG
ncbi:tyrosine-type recombinase/integrase [Mycobacterium sp. SMC-13]